MAVVERSAVVRSVSESVIEMPPVSYSAIRPLKQALERTCTIANPNANGEAGRAEKPAHAFGAPFQRDRFQYIANNFDDLTSTIFIDGEVAAASTCLGKSNCRKHGGREPE